MDTTPVYDLPFPESADDPNIPADMEALALAVEAELVRADTANDFIVYTASGTLTALQAAGAKAVRFRVWSGGGGGGGAAATAAGQSALGGGGRGGAYAESLVPFASLVFPVAITVGAGGTGTTGAGGTGGTSSAVNGATTYASVTGGAGGAAAGAGTTVGGGTAGGTAAPTMVGDLTIAGQNGGIGMRIVATLGTSGVGGAGAQGGSGGSASSGSASNQGDIGVQPGGGGGGASNGQSQSAAAGGVGATGRVVVELIY